MIKNNVLPTVGIIGAGRLGTVLARQLLKANYKVTLANSRQPNSLRLMINILLPGASAAVIEDVARHNDIVILAIPLGHYSTLQPDWFVGKIVIDAMNYWSPTEGFIPEFSGEGISTSAYIAQYLPDARVVKSLNHVAYSELEEHSLVSGSIQRRSIALAGDDIAAKQTVARLINDIGFDPLDTGAMTTGIFFQPDTPLFNARLTSSQMSRLVQTS